MGCSAKTMQMVSGCALHPQAVRIRPLAGHCRACLRAIPAGLGAALAMAVGMSVAFIGAGQAYLAAEPAEMPSHLAVARHGTGRQRADGRAIHIQRHAADHHLDIAFLQAFGKAGIAGGGTGVAGIDAGLVLVGGIHRELLSVGKKTGSRQLPGI